MKKVKNQINSNQLTLLQDMIESAVDEIIKNNLKKWLKKCIEDSNIEFKDAIKLFNEAYIEKLLSEMKIPLSVREAWGKILIAVRTNNLDSISKEVIDELKKYPNYNPINLALIENFSKEIAQLNETGRTYLLRLREAYLGMTPLDNYNYTQNNSYQFKFRLGNCIFGLDRLGLNMPDQNKPWKNKLYFGDNLDILSDDSSDSIEDSDIFNYEW